MNTNRKPGLLLSLIPVVVLVSLLVLNINLYKDDAVSGANQMALLLSAMVAAIIGVGFLKIPYSRIESKVVESIGLSMQANIILLLVGSLIALWIISGVVPTMIYYGIDLINPQYFLPLTCIVCAIVSLATGSSWSTGGTVGIAFMGIGSALGVPNEMTAGAVISGAYFGDKMSPLSDTTNLAPAMAGTDLFTHIRHMVYTTGPTIILAVLGFTALGFVYRAEAVSPTQIQEILTALGSAYHVNLWLLLMPLGVIAMVIFRIPAIPGMLFGCLASIVFALYFQYDHILAMVDGNDGFAIYKKILTVSYAGSTVETGNAIVDKLLSRGGMANMLNTVWIIICAMIFGGVMDATKMIHVIAESMLKAVKGVGSLVGATLSSCVFLNLTASDQYLSIVVTGKMFRHSYEKRKLHPKNLSRALEDGGTVTSVLVPWNSGGAYFSSILGVSTLAYLPFCFFNILSPFMSFLIASQGWTMEKLDGSIDKPKTVKPKKVAAPKTAPIKEEPKKEAPKKKTNKKKKGKKK